MRSIFIGTVDIGWHCLKALLEIKANVVGIFTADKQKMIKQSGMQPDYFREFNDLSEKWNVPLYKVDSTGIPLDSDRIRALKPNVIFCIGWPQIINREILRIPPSGCIGIHPTLLPERRGGAPINWTLIDGLSESGVTLFYFDEGVDSGDIIGQQKFRITLKDNVNTVLEKVTRISTQLIKRHYPLLESGKASRIPQNNSRATYTRRRRPEDGAINWRQTSLSVYNLIRAVTRPFPGAFTFWDGKKIIVWEVELLKEYKPRLSGQPGEVIGSIPSKGLVVVTGDYCILIKSVGYNGETLSGDEILQRLNISPGMVLGQ